MNFKILRWLPVLCAVFRGAETASTVQLTFELRAPQDAAGVPVEVWSPMDGIRSAMPVLQGLARDSA